MYPSATLGLWGPSEEVSDGRIREIQPLIAGLPVNNNAWVPPRKEMQTNND